MKAAAIALVLAITFGATGCGITDAADGDAGVDAGTGDGHAHSHSHVHGDAGNAGDEEDAGSTDASKLYEWELPPGFPVPKVPQDNPVTEAKVELGRHLFYDKRLSGNGTQSCGSCHEQARAFTDGRPVGIGSTGEPHVRGAMSLVNVAYASAFTWANATLGSLEDQALVPMLGENPTELGLSGRTDAMLQALRDDAQYPALFAAAFPSEPQPITLGTVVKAIATFERAIISGNSPYDRYQLGDVGALSDAAERGRDLFFSENLECFHCHGGFNFSGSVTHEGKVFDENTFHNNGLYNLDGKGAYPDDNQGLFAFTGDPKDMGRFKAPTLRNIAVTAPYMHDGSIATLGEVIDHYAAGGRLTEEGPYAGDGRTSPVKSAMITGFALSVAQKADLTAFLENLTDEKFLSDSRYADPTPTQPRK